MKFAKHLLFFIVAFISAISSFSQVIDRLPCLDKKFSVVAHIVEDSLGNAVVTEADILTNIDTLNRYFSPICVSFEVCEFKYIKDWRYDEFDVDSHWVEMQVKYHEEQRINIFYVFNINNPAGECSYSDQGYITHTDSSGLVIRKDGNACYQDNLKALVHEMGHYFGLLDTFEGSELVDGSNCVTDGDQICDTPADPGGTCDPITCRFIDMDTDSNGDYFTPHVGNAMSDFPGACMCEFTYEQLLYMANFYLTGTGNW